MNTIRGRRRNRWRAKADKRYWQDYWDAFYGYKAAEEAMFSDEWEGDDPEDLEDYSEFWFEECGQGQDFEGCTKAGSEECDFECPFRDEMYQEAIAS